MPISYNIYGSQPVGDTSLLAALDVNSTTLWYAGSNQIVPTLTAGGGSSINITSSGGTNSDYTFILCKRKHNVASLGVPYTRNTVLNFTINSSNGGIGIGILSLQGGSANVVLGALFTAYNTFGYSSFNVTNNSNTVGSGGVGSSYGNSLAVKLAESSGTVNLYYSTNGGSTFTQPGGYVYSGKYSNVDYSNNYPCNVVLVVKHGTSGVNATINGLTINGTYPWATF